MSLTRVLRIFALIITLAASAVVSAQVPVEVSAEKIVSGGKVYYLHEVQKSQTLFIRVIALYSLYTREEPDHLAQIYTVMAVPLIIQELLVYVYMTTTIIYQSLASHKNPIRSYLYD